MNIFSKLFTALKSGANEMGEALVDANAITIFEQEISDAQSALGNAKENEMSLLALKRQAEAKLKMHQNSIAEYEDHVRSAMDKGEHALALETANHIVQLQQEQIPLEEKVLSLQQNCEKINAQIKKADAQIQDMENQLSQIKATESVHQAQESLHASLNKDGSSVVSARESLERIKQQQAYTNAKIEVSEELDTQASLNKKLADAGITKGDDAAIELLKKLAKKK